MLTHVFSAPYVGAGHDGARPIVFPLGGQGGFEGESLAGFGGGMAKAAASSRCVGPARVSQPLSLYWVGRARSDRVGINQPQADRFMAPALEQVSRSFLLIPLASGPAKPGRGTAVSL